MRGGKYDERSGGRSSGPASAPVAPVDGAVAAGDEPRDARDEHDYDDGLHASFAPRYGRGGARSEADAD